MARSGGTVLCKCLGSMHDIVLLSEIHHAGTSQFNPLDQANEWYELLTPTDLDHLRRSGEISFPTAISLINQRCLERGKTLLIRDWSHLDFTAVPFFLERTDRLTTADVLQNDFTVVNTASVRHPIDQWLSLRGQAIMRNRIDLKTFLQGYRAFAEQCLRIGFTRYEDFTVDPGAVLSELCSRLNLSYDSGFRDRWSSYTNITGDSGKGRVGSSITTPRRRPMEDGLLDEFQNSEDYQHIVRMLGYGVKGVDSVDRASGQMGCPTI